MHDEHIVSTGEEIKNGLSKCKKNKKTNKHTKQNKQTNKQIKPKKKKKEKKEESYKQTKNTSPPQKSVNFKHMSICFIYSLKK